MVKDRRKQAETVYTTTQRERSRGFKEALKSYGKRTRQELQSPRRTVSSRIGSTIASGLSMFQRGAVTRKLYGQPVSPYGSNIRNIPMGQRTGRRGRPRGSVKYVDSQGNPIGVYQARKLDAQRRWKERQEILQRSVTNPAQLQRFRQIQAQDEAMRRSPEARVIPDTVGFVPTKNIFDEINSYSNLVE